MTREEYQEYEAAVADFMLREGIANLTGGYPYCPKCGAEWDEQVCPHCGEDRECWEEPFFSWNRCQCCGTTLGGNREHATGYNPATGDIQEYTVCEDCIYYAAYGRLDDRTMAEIECS